MATGRYVLHERIGVGGMAEVFRAVARGAEGFERVIAIKRILPHLGEDDDFLKMFVDEAKIAVQLQHPNIVQILDLGRAGQDYFIAMEMVHGKDLRIVQDKAREMGERLPLAVVCHVAMKSCAALHHAHTATGAGGRPLAIVHRDVSPQNVMLSFDGEVKVTDFGLAKAAGRVAQTQNGVVKGKLAYMSPEQLTLGMSIDHRCDIYGIGILLWEMLTGTRLFIGQNDVDTVAKVQLGVIPAPRSIDPEIPEEVERIVLRALARDRDLRYQSAEEIHDDLEAFAYGTQTFVTSASLGAWLRDRFPQPAPVRGPEIATREIRLADVGASGRRRDGSGSGERRGLDARRAPDPDEETDDGIQRDQLEAAMAGRAALEPPELDSDAIEFDGDLDLVQPLDDVAVPRAAAAAREYDFLDDPTLTPGDDPFTNERDTTRPPAPQAFFDDTTGNMSAREARALMEKSASIEEPLPLLSPLSSRPPGAPQPAGSGPPSMAPGPVSGQPAVQPRKSQPAVQPRAPDHDPWGDATTFDAMRHNRVPPEPFDDTTGKMAPQVIEVRTEERYDRDLIGGTVEITGSVDSGWDDDETTQITDELAADLPPKPHR